MPRACFFLDHFWGERSGGAEWQTFVLCRALREHGWDVRYFAESLTGKTGTTEEAHGIRVHWLPALQWRSRIHPAQLRLFERIRTMLDDLRPDVLYTRGNNCFSGIGVCHRYKARRNVKCVWGAAADWEISRRFYRDRLRYYKKARWRKALLWCDASVKDRDHAAEITAADCVVVQTEQQGKRVREEFGKDSVELRSSHEVPQEMSSKASPPTAVFVAHIGRRKRVELFLDVAGTCADMAARFLVIGDFPEKAYEDEIRELANGLKNVEFTGPLSADDTNHRIAQATVLVSTTDPGSEGYPNVFIQAWLRGTPVVSLAHDPDGVIASNAALGRFAGTTDRLAFHVRELLAGSTETHAQGMLAREWAIRHHSYEVNQSRIVEIFTTLAESGKV